MFESYLFIPGNRLDFIRKIDSLKADYIIVDLEDSISSDEVLLVCNNLKIIDEKSNIFVRLPFFEKDVFNLNLLQVIINLGFNKFVVPKISEKQQLVEIRDLFEKSGSIIENMDFIILVESAKSLMLIKDFIELKLINIYGIALGSYDYCLDMNMQYDIKNFDWARNYLLNLSKAYQIKAIDIVSMEITSMENFREELRSSINLGFDGKLFIHPIQLEELKNIDFYTKDQISEAYRICSLIDKSKNHDTNIFVVDGKVYEKPHIKKMLDIINWQERYGKQ